jgi:hypothetical protein
MSVVLIILPVFLLIAVGFGLRRAFHFPDSFWPQLDRMIYFVLLPALVFHSLSGFRVDLQSALPMLQAGALFMLSGMGIGYLVKHLVPAPPMVFASAYQCFFRFNSYIGLAIAVNIHGPQGIAAFGLLMGFMVPLANVAAVWMLAKHGEGNFLKEILLNPLVISTVAGIGFSLSGLELAKPVRDTFGLLAQASLPMGLVAVGAGLRLRGISHHKGLLWLTVVFKILVLPAIAYGIGQALGLQGLYLHMVVIIAALPQSTVSYVLAARMGGDGAIAAAQVVMTTLLAMVTLPFWLKVLGF